MKFKRIEFDCIRQQIIPGLWWWGRNIHLVYSAALLLDKMMIGEGQTFTVHIPDFLEEATIHRTDVDSTFAFYSDGTDKVGLCVWELVRIFHCLPSALVIEK